MRTWAGVLVAVCVVTGPVVQAQSYSAFGFKPPADLIVPAIKDALWQFCRRLQTGRLSAPQEARVLAHLDGLVQGNASLGLAIAGTRRVIQQLTVGKLGWPHAQDVPGRVGRKVGPARADIYIVVVRSGPD